MHKAGIKIAILSARWELHRRKGLDSLQKTVECARRAFRFTLWANPPNLRWMFACSLTAVENKPHQVLAWPPEVDAPRLNQEVGASCVRGDFCGPHGALCDAGLCAYRTAEDFLYSDFGHLSEYGARSRCIAYFLSLPGRARIPSWPAPENRADIAD